MLSGTPVWQEKMNPNVELGKREYENQKQIYC